MLYILQKLMEENLMLVLREYEYGGIKNRKIEIVAKTRGTK